MHIVLGALGSLVTVLWLLHRLAEMGIDLGGLNPWLWRRRRNWRKGLDGNPIYKIDHPMDATALLLTAVAKADGDMSGAEKSTLLDIFAQEFKLSRRDASSLLQSSTHLLGRGEEVRENLSGVLAPSLAAFTDEQLLSARELLIRIGNAQGSATPVQRELIDAATAIIDTQREPAGKWA